MPVEKYFKGKGREVLKKMRERYGSKEGTRVFYATANSRDMNPPGKKRKKSRR